MIKIYNKNGVILNTQDKYCNENIEVAIDTTDLTPENILKGKRILGIDGTAEVGSGGGITPSGEITLTTEGTFDVAKYASAKVEVAKEEQTITPTKDIINVYPSDGKFLNKVVVNPIPSNYISPAGETSATANGRYDCTEYAWFNVNVPETIPEGYIKPEGSVEITSNGNHDVANYATATVNVPIPDGYIVPTGTISVTENGTVNVTSYASAEINVPIPDGYILPSGNFEITANGDYDITDKKTVSVNVPTSGGDSLWAEIMDGRLKSKNFSYLFAYSKNLLDVTPYLAGYDTSSVQYADYMFYTCNNLKTIQLFNTSSVTSMSHMFELSGISTIPLLNTSNVTNMDNMFYYTNITTLPQLDTHNVTSMDNMFGGCTKLTSLPQLDTSKVTSMHDMFMYCTKLTSLPQLDTSNVTNMSNMFMSCSKLTSLPQLDTSKVTSMRSMFQGCYMLETVDITSMDKINYTSSSNSLFQDCSSLKKIIIRNMTVIPKLSSSAFNNRCYHFFGTVDATYNPDGLADGYLYVPDDKVETLKSATNWSKIATQIKPLSELGE